MTIEHIKLNRCPFCGKHPEYSKKFLDLLGKHMIECSSPDCAVVFFGTTFEDVAQKWDNRQPTSAELIPRITAIIEKLDSRCLDHGNKIASGIINPVHRGARAGAITAITETIVLLEESLKP